MLKILNKIKLKKKIDLMKKLTIFKKKIIMFARKKMEQFDENNYLYLNLNYYKNQLM